MAQSRLSFKIRLDDLVDPSKLEGITKTNRNEIVKRVNEFVVDRILLDTANHRSSVSGQKWKGLDKKSPYYKEKQKKVGHTRPNLELTGAMLDALKGVVKKDEENTGEIGVFGKAQAEKADGHCHTGKFGAGPSSLPIRQFIPGEGQSLRSGIMTKLVQLAKQLVDEAPKKKGFEDGEDN